MVQSIFYFPMQEDWRSHVTLLGRERYLVSSLSQLAGPFAALAGDERATRIRCRAIQSDASLSVFLTACLVTWMPYLSTAFLGAKHTIHIIC